jgi:hypothetical protein
MEILMIYASEKCSPLLLTSAVAAFTSKTGRIDEAALTRQRQRQKPTKLLRHCELNETRGIAYTPRHLSTLESENKLPKRVIAW